MHNVHFLLLALISKSRRDDVTMMTESGSVQQILEIEDFKLTSTFVEIITLHSTIQATITSFTLIIFLCGCFKPISAYSALYINVSVWLLSLHFEESYVIFLFVLCVVKM